MAYRAVLFDLDGTLLDTLDDLADAVNRCLQAQGLPPHPTHAYRYFVGDGAQKLIERALPEAQREPAIIHDTLQDFLADYSQHWAIKTHPYPGIDKLLDALHAHHITTAILSNKPDAFMEQVVRRFLPNSNFTIIRGQREDTPPKPDPAAALQIADTLKLAPAEILYLGDTATDMHTACAAGMLPVGVTWGFRESAELRGAGARHLIETPLALLPILTTEPS